MSDLSFAKQFGPDYPPPFPDWFFAIDEAVHRLLDDPRCETRFCANLLRWRDELPDGPIEVPAGDELTLPWRYLILVIIHDVVESSRGEGSLGRAMTINPWSEPNGADVNETASWRQFVDGHDFLCAKVSLIPDMKGADQRWVQKMLRDVECDLLLHQMLEGPDDIKLSEEEYKRIKLAFEIERLAESLSVDELNRLTTITERNRPRAEGCDETAVGKTAMSDKTPKRCGPTVNQRMLDKIDKDTKAVSGWTAKQWAEHLKCGQSTVVETRAWKRLAMAREKQNAERAVDRRRNRSTDREATEHSIDRMNE